MLPKKQILVVEDNLLNREMLLEILTEQYSVLEAQNGKEALEILKKCGDKIALILLDVMMPVMNGFTFLDRIKADPELSLIPVIIMTQSDGEDNEVAALAHGATDFVPKPYRPQVILHRVASIIKLRETASMVNQFKYDRLTGIYSKEYFYHKVREELDENPEKEYTIVCFNIENFKLYNDTFGMKAGDQLLKEVANNIRIISGDSEIYGRYGADRFLFLKEREKEREDRKNLFNKANLTRPDEMDNMSARWGIYEIYNRSVPVEQMCDRALLAADSVKGQYNRPFAVYDYALRVKLLREKAITDAMETALKERQFDVYLQPKYSLRNACVAGAEALVRWNHPELGFLSPGEFIPLFEKNGFIPRLDQYVWETVCAKLRDWKDKSYPLFPVSVNVSRADVYQSNLVDTLLGLTKKYGIDPIYLHLEITESAYTDNHDKIISAVEELRKLGFIVEMDDFGSGYSSLNMLSQMELDVLKLDMKFIQNEVEKSAEHSILNDVINMAHRMRLSVVAEGVETREQMARLDAVGCDYVQGYFFAKPMPIPEFEELMKSQSVQTNAPSPKEQRKEPCMRSLLVVEEDAEYREKVRDSFEGQYRILEASDADGALDYIKSCGCEGISSVILSMTLPEDGAALVLKAMRQDPAFWRVPILATIPRCDVSEKLPLALEADDFLCKCHPMTDLQRRVTKMIETAASQKHESTLQEKANSDYLTGLLNRRGLWDAVDALRQEDLPLALYFFDLDNLKEVNDCCGHNVGDQVLKFFSELLRRSTRSGDILCRYGGDEFVAIIGQIPSKEIALKRGEEICSGFCKCDLAKGIKVTCSCGIAMCEDNEKPSLKLIDRADRAQYRVKREGKGKCCLWESDET